MIRQEVSDKMSKAPLRKISVTVKEIKVKLWNYNREGQYVRDRNYNHDNNFKWGNYGNRNDQSGPYVPPQNW